MMKKIRRTLVSNKMSRLVLPGIILFLSFIAFQFFTSNAKSVAESKIAEQALETLDVQTEAILTQLEKYRYLPRVVALQPFSKQFLLEPERGDFQQDVKNQLQKILGYSGALEIAIADKEGEILLSVGSFFDKTIDDVELMIAPTQNRLGRSSVTDNNNNRAYAFSSRVNNGNEYLGFVTVIAPLEAIERSWALSGKPVFATNERGQIVAKDFQTEEFVTAIFQTINNPDIKETEFISDETGDMYKIYSRPIALIGWRLHVLENWASVNAAGRSAGLISLLASALAGMIALLFFSRFKQRMIKDRLEKANAIRLERKVNERTKELVQINSKLEIEITEREQAENALLKAQKELIQAGKLAGLGQMSAALSHEFNQPLAAIKSYADNANQYLHKKRFGEVEENVKHILELTDRMAAISKHLRNFARRPKEKTSPVLLPAVIDDALEIISTKLKSVSAEVTVDLPENLPLVVAGHTRLQQVIVNLISNAIDAKSPRKKLNIAISGEREGEKVSLIVQDNGVGLPDNVLEQIFDPFFTTKDVNKGLGLGMSISYNIIKDFGGDISVQNRPEGGAEVRIHLLQNSEYQKAAE